MKTLVSTPNIIEAEQIKADLQDADIDAQILEDNNTFFASTPDAANYRIIVSDDDFDNANTVLQNYREQNKENETLPWCPECGNNDVTETIIRHRYGSIWFLILAPILLAIGLFIPLPEYLIYIRYFCLFGALCFIIQFFIGYKVHRFKCNKCNHIFKRY